MSLKTTGRLTMALACLGNMAVLQAGEIEYLSRVSLSEASAAFIRDEAYYVTESGALAGSSFGPSIPGESGSTQAAWIADLNGQTTRVGLFDAGGGNEFTSSSGKQTSSVKGLTESGWVWGSSFRYGGLSSAGFPRRWELRAGWRIPPETRCDMGSRVAPIHGPTDIS